MESRRTKLFEIKSLFYKVECKKIPFKAGDLKEIKNGPDTIPVLSAGLENQGLAYYAPREGATIIKNAISVSANGANSGVMFYHPFEFSVLQDSYAIKFIGRELNEKEYLFMLTCLQKIIRSNYSWTNKAGWEKIKLLKIELPVNSDDEIDFDFINDYMGKLIDAKLKEMKTNMESAGYLPEPLTEAENKIIAEYFEGKHGTKKVKIKDLFSVVYNPSLDKGKLVFSDNGEYPYFTRTVFNNGISGLVEYYDDEHLMKGNSIAVGLLQMVFFYMEKDFYAGQFTKTIYPKFDGFNEQIGLFFVSLFNKQNEKFKSVLVRDFDKCFLESEIEVPINEDGNLDLEFISSLMGAIKKEVFSSVKLD